MLRFGTVKHIDEKKGAVRVEFKDADKMLSYWLPVMQSKTLKDKFYSLPDENELVACLMDENSEEGVVMGAIYSEADLAPVFSRKKFHVQFEDGTIIEYDKELKKLTALVQGIAEITALEEINLNAPIILLNATDINFIGNITHEGNLVSSGTYNGKDFISSGKSGKSHTHSDPQGGTTGGPN